MPRVLVVDDSELDRRLVGGLLAENESLVVDFAENGAAALDRMSAEPPDLVLSDMQMPEVDGLQLVGRARLQFPRVPVVLMTAHGSESLAVEALARGAASYVPKVQLAQHLLDTVEEILALTRADRSYERLIGCLERTEFLFQLDNDAALVDPLVDLIQQMAVGMKLVDFTERVRLGVALKEALLNALYRGNLELDAKSMEDARERMLLGGPGDIVERRRREAPYCDRRTTVEVLVRPDQARFVIRDQGPGFDVTAVLAGGDGHDALSAPHGRGLRLIKAFMDEVTFNPAGNEITLVKRRVEVENA